MTNLEQIFGPKLGGKLKTLGGIKALKHYEPVDQRESKRIVAFEEAVEAYNRIKEDTFDTKKITCSFDIFSRMEDLRYLDHEEFWILYLNRGNKVIHKKLHSKGGIVGTVVDRKILCREALLLKASNVIAVHNHPSGNTKPSHEDNKATTELKDALKAIDVVLLDHVIIGLKGFYSYSDEGNL